MTDDKPVEILNRTIHKTWSEVLKDVDHKARWKTALDKRDKEIQDIYDNQTHTSLAELAEKFNLSKTQVWKIVHGDRNNQPKVRNPRVQNPIIRRNHMAKSEQKEGT